MKSVIKRILGTIPVLIGVVLLIFIMLRIVPGNAAAMLLGEHVDQATIDRLTEVMGLDKPVIVGATGATQRLQDGIMVSVDCARGVVQTLPQ